MDAWTRLEMLPFFPIDPSTLPERVHPDILRTAVVTAATRPEWREALVARLADEHGLEPPRPSPPQRLNPNFEATSPMTSPARLDELHENESVRRHLGKNPNATEAQLLRWAEDPVMHWSILANPWAPPAVVEGIFTATEDAALRDLAGAHPRAPGAVFDAVSPRIRCKNPSASREFLMSVIDDKEQNLFINAMTMATNHGADPEVLAAVAERIGGNSVRFNPSAPAELLNIVPQRMEWPRFAACPSTSRERCLKLLDQVPGNGDAMVALLVRPDLDLDAKHQIIERMAPAALAKVLGVRLDSGLSARLVARILKDGDSASREGLIRRGDFTEEAYAQLCAGSQRNVETLLGHASPAARRAALVELERLRPELAGLIAQHPDSEGAPAGVELGVPARAPGPGPRARAHAVAPPSTARIETLADEGAAEFSLLAHASTESPRLVLVAKVRGALRDEEALREWLVGLRWTDDRPLPWSEEFAPAEWEGGLEEGEGRGFLSVPEWLAGRADDLAATLPQECRILVDDADENAALGVWLLRDGDDGVLLVREWTL